MALSLLFPMSPDCTDAPFTRVATRPIQSVHMQSLPSPTPTHFAFLLSTEYTNMNSIPSNDTEAARWWRLIRQHTLAEADLPNHHPWLVCPVRTEISPLYNSDLCELPRMKDLLDSLKLDPGNTDGSEPILAGFNAHDPTCMKWVLQNGQVVHARIGCPKSRRRSVSKEATSIEQLFLDEFVAKGYGLTWLSKGEDLRRAGSSEDPRRFSPLLLTSEALEQAEKAAKELPTGGHTDSVSPHVHWLPNPDMWSSFHKYVKFSNRGPLLGPRLHEGRRIYVPVGSSVQTLSSKESPETSQTVESAFHRWTCGDTSCDHSSPHIVDSQAAPPSTPPSTTLTV